MKNTTAISTQSIQVTPEYLYDKGIAFYKDALTEKINFEQQAKFLKSILYLQGAMLLGSNDACQQLKRFYDEENNIGISQPDQRLNKLIEAMQQQYEEINIHKPIKNNLLGDILINLKTIKPLKTKFLNEQPEYLVPANLQSFIKEVNNKLPKDYCLITNEEDFEKQKKITDFILPKKSTNVIIPELFVEQKIREEKYVDDNNYDLTGVTGEEFCNIS